MSVELVEGDLLSCDSPTLSKGSDMKLSSLVFLVSLGSTSSTLAIGINPPVVPNGHGAGEVHLNPPIQGEASNPVLSPIENQQVLRKTIRKLIRLADIQSSDFALPLSLEGLENIITEMATEDHAFATWLRAFPVDTATEEEISILKSTLISNANS